MDLNNSYFEHQILLMRAAMAPSASAHAIHLDRADTVAGRIACFQKSAGAAAASSWTAGCVSKTPVRRVAGA